MSIVATVAALLTSTPNAPAIEGLQLSLQCSNVVLSWPSIAGQNYIIQYRPTLDPSTPWQTLTNLYPGDWTTNVTVFVHSNIVQHPNCGETDGGSLSAMSLLTDSAETTAVAPPVPMAMRADGTGSAVPLALYPPGFDLSNFIILDPSTGEWASGAGMTRQLSMFSTANDGPPTPLDGGSGDGGTNSTSTPETGFYQVVQDGVQIASSSMFNLTNGVVSGTLNIAFEAGNADPNNSTNLLGTLSSAALLVDGEKYIGGASLGASTRPWKFALDTAYLENGTHYIQIQVSWLNPDSGDNVNPYFERWTDGVSVTVSNQIYYPDWEPEVGEAGVSAYFLKTTCSDADWSVDIFDVRSNFVQRLTGHTTDGTIEAYWNMVDTNGVTRTNADVDPEFSSIVTVADPATKATPKKKQRKNDWPDHGKWVIAFQDYFKFEYSENNAQQGSINWFANTSAKYGGYYLHYPQPGQTNDLGQTYPLRYDKANHPDTNITQEARFLDEQLLRIYLGSTNSRNFYYDGHADSDNIVSGSLDVAMLSATIQHRYRFVFLNGCNTANGDLDTAFGIHGPKRLDSDYYHKTGIRPAAFMGYTTKIYYDEGGPVMENGVQYDDTIPYQVPGFITNFLLFWDSMGYGLLSAVDNAKQYLPPVRNQYREDYLAIHGYFNLHIDEVNHRYDTW
jgi:hypothetical protein